MNINYLPTTTTATAMAATAATAAAVAAAGGVYLSLTSIVICNLPEQKCVSITATDACSLHRYEVSFRYTLHNKLACGRPIVAMKNFGEKRAHRENEKSAKMCS